MTPKIIDEADKPLNSQEIENRKVDINVLKARAKAIEDKLASLEDDNKKDTSKESKKKSKKK